MSLTETSEDLRVLEHAIAGRYALERELGRGGMGVVLLARFLREARTAVGLSRPNIVPIHAVEAHDGIVFIAMAFVDGAHAPPVPAVRAAHATL